MQVPKTRGFEKDLALLQFTCFRKFECQQQYCLLVMSDNILIVARLIQNKKRLQLKRGRGSLHLRPPQRCVQVEDNQLREFCSVISGVGHTPFQSKKKHIRRQGPRDCILLLKKQAFAVIKLPYFRASEVWKFQSQSVYFGRFVEYISRWQSQSEWIGEGCARAQRISRCVHYFRNLTSGRSLCFEIFTIQQFHHMHTLTKHTPHATNPHRTHVG